MDKNITMGDLKGTLGVLQAFERRLRQDSAPINSTLLSLVQKWMFLVLHVMEKVAKYAVEKAG